MCAFVKRCNGSGDPPVYIYIGMVTRYMVTIFVMKVDRPTRDFVYVPVHVLYILSVPVIWCMGSVSEGTLKMAIFIQWSVKQVYLLLYMCLWESGLPNFM